MEKSTILGINMIALDEKNESLLKSCNEICGSLQQKKKFKGLSFSDFFTFLFIFDFIKLYKSK
jgi:hypothetical protein